MACRKFVPVIAETPQSSAPIRGRGASWSPANRFEKLHVDLTDVDVVQVDSIAGHPESRKLSGSKDPAARPFDSATGSLDFARDDVNGALPHKTQTHTPILHYSK